MEKITDQQFIDFYDKNVEKIYRFVFFRVPGAQEAQDITSETFTRVWQYVSEGHEIENLRALLYQTARNLLNDYYRLASRRDVALEDGGNQNNLVSESDILEKKMDKDLNLRRIKKALGNIKEEYQEVIILRYLNDFDLKETAEIIKKSYGATRVLLTRALTSLKKELDKS